MFLAVTRAWFYNRYGTVCPAEVLLRNPVLIAVAILAPVILAPGCNNRVKQVEQDMASLRTRVDSLARSTSSFRSRVENIENRVLLIQDEIETQQVAAMRAGNRPPPPPQLPTVTLRPEYRERSAPTESSDIDAQEFLTGSESADRSVYQQIDDQGRIVANRGARSGSRKHPAKARRPKPPRKHAATSGSDALREYRAAYEIYQQGRVNEAMELFRRFVAQHPRHPHADNAQYWIGECLYDKRDFEGAKREFMRVVSEHPDGNKVPDAMVKVGLCAKNMGQNDEARRMFNTVMLTYPDSDAAAVAMKLTGELP